MKNFSIVFAFAPVFNKTGISIGTEDLTSSKIFKSGSLPAIGPDTKITSARDETTVDFAIIAADLEPTAEANSGVMLAKIARSSRPKLRRSRNNFAASGAQGPISDSQNPVTTSRMKLAPVATAIASAQLASHRKSTPNGISLGLHSVTTLLITAAASSPAFS